MSQMNTSPGLRPFILSLLILLVCAPLRAEERITSFASRITVERSGLLTVSETIAVQAEGSEIKRGIYRDFPTEYTNGAGLRVRVSFTPVAVDRDGHPEPYHLKNEGNGIRVYIGQEDVFLAPGPYTYTLTYQTSRQIGFFADYDELYWNVTGNGWSFPIDNASATITLPPGTPILRHAVYTGPQGATAQAAEVTEQSGNSISFRTTAPLAPREGLTVAVAWPKGVVTPPNDVDKTLRLVQDNLTLLLAGAGMLLLLGYYLVVWYRVGRDPEPGTIIPRFEPPKGFNPAAARFVLRMGSDHKGFASALVDMAVQKYLVIAEDKGTFTLERTKAGGQQSLSGCEKKVADKLFAGGDRLELKSSNHATIQGAISALDKGLRDGFEALHFRRNRIYLLPGVGITLLILLTILLGAQDKGAAGFLGVWLSIWTIGCYVLLVQTRNAWKAAAAGPSLLAKGAALFLTFFSLPFLAAWVFAMAALGATTSYSSVAGLMAVISLNLLFYHLLKAPTILGRKVMDQLEGLKLYLSVAEKERLNLLNPPEKTPELFERFLPWALALDVEQEWSEQFSEVLARAGTESDYHPAWYTGHDSFTAHSLAASLGSSLAGSIAS